MSEFICLAEGCSKSFPRKNMRTIHLRVYHDISRIINCRYCDEEFLSEASLLSHQQTVHSELFFENQQEKTRLLQIETAQKSAKTSSILKNSNVAPKRKSPVVATPPVKLNKSSPSVKSNKSAEFVESDNSSEISNRASDDFSDSDSSINLSFSSSDAEEKLQEQFSGNKLVCKKCQILFQDRSKLKAHRRLVHKDDVLEKSENLTRSKTTLHITSSEDSDEEGDLTEGMMK